MIRSAPVAARAVERAGVPRSADSVVAATTTHQIGQSNTGTGSGGTQLLTIDVTDEDPVVARTLANAMADSFVEEVQNFEPTAPTSEGSIPALPAYVFERARLPVVPQPTGLVTNLLVAALLGLFLGVGVVLLEDYLDITIRGVEDAERRLGLPVLGAIPQLGATATTPLRPRREPRPQAIASGRGRPGAGAGRTARLLGALAEQADLVLVDTAPVLPVADTLVVGRFAAGALLVIEARATPVPSISRAKDALTRNQTRILGLVINRLKAQDSAYSYGYYGYGEPEPNGERPAGE